MNKNVYPYISFPKNYYFIVPLFAITALVRKKCLLYIFLYSVPSAAI